MNSNYSQYVRGLLSNAKNYPVIVFVLYFINFLGIQKNLIVSACNWFFKSCFQQVNYKACQDIYESFKDELKEQIKYSPKNEIVTFCFFF